jgi:hypothetical protein
MPVAVEVASFNMAFTIHRNNSILLTIGLNCCCIPAIHCKIQRCTCLSAVV